MGGYVGIDESNHGRLPEYYVATFSLKREDPHPWEGLHKVRRKTFSMPETYQWRYLSFSHDDKTMLGDCGIKIVAATEFIRYFSEQYGRLFRVVFDGTAHNDFILEQIARELYPERAPPIRFEKKADKKYPLVNASDAMAYSLYRRGTEHDHSKKDDLEHLLDFEATDYSRIIENYRRHQEFLERFRGKKVKQK